MNTVNRGGARATPRYEPIAVSGEATVVAEFVRDAATQTSYQSEAELERALIKQLVQQGYERLHITSSADLEANLRSQLERLDDFHARNATAAAAAVRRLQDVATGGGNVFDELMRAARACSLGQLTAAFFEVGGQYRRNV